MTTPPLDFPFPNAFTELLGADFDAKTIRRSFDAILGGSWAPTQIAAFLGALRVRGETAEIVAAAAASMRAAMVRLPHHFEALLDTCGTGGDGSGSVNLSTGAAILCAASGVAVAKHGNRAASSQSGSADVLEALGIRTDLSPAQSARVLEEANITFLMAPTHHPAMRFAGPVRKELGIRTLFNCLGPLSNPASATHQLLGAFSEELRPVLASSLCALGTRRAWVVHGEDGLDEVSPYAPTRVTELDRGELREFVVRPEDFGLPTSEPGAAKGGPPAENAAILEQVLSGAPHPARNAFVLNAAAALVVASGDEYRQATARIERAITSGSALAKLQQWRALSRASEAS